MSGEVHGAQARVHVSFDAIKDQFYAFRLRENPHYRIPCEDGRVFFIFRRCLSCNGELFNLPSWQDLGRSAEILSAEQLCDPCATQLSSFLKGSDMTKETFLAERVKFFITPLPPCLDPAEGKESSAVGITNSGTIQDAIRKRGSEVLFESVLNRITTV